MAVPRNRRSKSKQGKVRSHHARKPKNTRECSNCHVPGLPARLCMACGFYNGKLVVELAKA